MPRNRVGPAAPGALPAEVRRLAEASTVLAKAAPGDIVLFRAHTSASAITKAVTRSGYSHAGIIAPFETPGGQLVLYEAARSMYGTINMLHGDEEFPGVHVWDMHERLGKYHGDSWLVPLSSPLNREQVAAVTEYCMKHAQDKTPFDQAQMIPAGLDTPWEANPGHQMFEAREDKDALFCTEFLAYALKEAGLLTGNAAEVTPADVLHFPFVGKPVLIKLYEAAETNPLVRLGVSRDVAEAVLKEELGTTLAAPPCIPTVSRSMHTSRYLLNRLPQGALRAAEGPAGTAPDRFVDDSGSTWERERSCTTAGCLTAPFCFTLRLQDSAGSGRLASVGSSSVLVGLSDLANGTIAAAMWSPGIYWFRDPRDSGCLQHLAYDVLPSACCWLLCCTGLQRRNRALEDRLVEAQGTRTT
mmetsp:Transcript_16982/g.47422  ORF Transcript_16982/g.47422 Transcript_16982/m.47422 type:complete len:414 (+) Transcript_16982:84-1325(+)